MFSSVYKSWEINTELLTTVLLCTRVHTFHHAHSLSLTVLVITACLCSSSEELLIEGHMCLTLAALAFTLWHFTLLQSNIFWLRIIHSLNLSTFHSNAEKHYPSYKQKNYSLYSCTQTARNTFYNKTCPLVVWSCKSEADSFSNFR